MATQQQCLAAIVGVVERFNAHDAGRKRERVPQRSVGVTVLDLDITYKADLVAGFLLDLHESATHQADIRLLCSSDDLLGLVDGDLSFANAWSTGRIHLDASIRDLVRLRSLL